MNTGMGLNKRPSVHFVHLCLHSGVFYHSVSLSNQTEINLTADGYL